MTNEILEKDLATIVLDLKNRGETERAAFLRDNKDAIISASFADKLKNASPQDVIEYLLLLPNDIFVTTLDQFTDIIAEKLSKAPVRVFARIFNELPKDLRKQFTSRFMDVIVTYVRGRSMSELLSLIYNLSPPSRPGLLSPIRPYLFGKDFQEKIIESSLEDLEAFLSVLPGDIRGKLVTQHKDTFLSDEFGRKIEKASSDEIIKILRWFPKDVYNAFLEKHGEILKQKGLRLE